MKQTLNNMCLVDSHIHVGLPEFCHAPAVEFPQDLCNTIEETITLMDEFDVEKAIVLPIPHRLLDSKRANEYAYEAYQKYPNRLIPFCRIDDCLIQNLQHGFRGCKLHMVYEDIAPRDIKVQLQIIEDFCVPLIVHAKFADKVKQIEDILKLAPNLNIILAHMGRGNLYTGEQVVENALGLKKYPNVYVDTSTVGDFQSIVAVGEILGFDRMLFGSDYPFGKNYFGANYDYGFESRKLRDILTDSEAQRVLHDNTLRLLEKSAPDTLKVRRGKREDLAAILNLFAGLTDGERKFLALDKKLSLIKQTIKKERHCYVALERDRIVGFMRESGRPHGVSLLEEIVTATEERNRGIAKVLLTYYHNAFDKTIAKTNAANKVMIHILQRYGYRAVNPEAPRIIDWERGV